MHEAENIGLLLREKRCYIDSNNVQRVFRNLIVIMTKEIAMAEITFNASIHN